MGMGYPFAKGHAIGGPLGPLDGACAMPNPGASKRAKERQREEKRQAKREKQELRKKEKLENPGAPVPEGEDPDIAGIVPGPQPLPDEGTPAP